MSSHISFKGDNPPQLETGQRALLNPKPEISDFKMEEKLL